MPAILIEHNQPADNILSQWFWYEGVSIRCGEDTFSGLFLPMFLFFTHLLCYLL